MRKARLLISMLTIMVLCMSVAYAQPQNIAIENWVGQVFRVLPLDSESQAVGYPFNLSKDPAAQTAQQGQNIPAAELENKLLEVVSVQPQGTQEGDSSVVRDYVVTFKVQETGKMISALALSGQMNHMVLEKDLLDAQQYFANKTVYAKQGVIFPTQPTAPPMTVSASEPLKAESVVPGVSASKPLLLMVKTQGGMTGYIPFSFSYTNQKPDIWNLTKPAWFKEISE